MDFLEVFNVHILEKVFELLQKLLFFWIVADGPIFKHSTDNVDGERVVLSGEQNHAVVELLVVVHVFVWQLVQRNQIVVQHLPMLLLDGARKTVHDRCKDVQNFRNAPVVGHGLVNFPREHVVKYFANGRSPICETTINSVGSLLQAFAFTMVPRVEQRYHFGQKCHTGGFLSDNVVDVRRVVNLVEDLVHMFEVNPGRIIDIFVVRFGGCFASDRRKRSEQIVADHPQHVLE
mmetsp:Transcript_23814/g.34791  ORF Transcript_23814/g.34791 Transcript_23814/m.34791 type:complete len:233 (-) Transcript_23814:756-1454(-)